MSDRRPRVAKILRMTPEEAATLRETACDLGLTTTAVLRLLVRNARFLVVSIPPIEAVVDGEDVDADPPHTQ